MSERIQILLPAAERIYRPQPRPIAPRLAALTDMRVGFIDNTFTSIRVIHDELRRLLATSSIEVIEKHKKYWDPLDHEQLGDLAKCADAIVGCLGGTSPSTVCAVRDAVALEEQGRPTVTFVTQYFEDLFAETAIAEGMPDLRRIVLPSPLEDLPEGELRGLAGRAFEHVVASLTQPAVPAVIRLLMDDARI